MSNFTAEEYFKYLCKDPVAVQHFTNLQRDIDIAADIELTLTMLQHELKESKKLLSQIANCTDDSDIKMMIEGSGLELGV